MRKTIASICVMLLIGFIFLGLSGCGKKENVKLTVWGSEASHDMLREIADEFIALHKNEADIEIILRVEDEDTAVDNALNAPDSLADVFSFAGDQMNRLTNAGLLLEVTDGVEDIIEQNGGRDSVAIQVSMVDGKVYAYPLTASNGYFMYYNADYFDENDVKTLDGMLDKAAEHGKYVSMDWKSGWYIYSFFGGAGMHIYLEEDGKHNFCDWNRTDGAYKGVDVAQAMLAIADSPAFYNTDDAGFKDGIKSGEIIAGVNGPWNAEYVKSIWGEQYRAVKLPTYTIADRQVQMGSFSGYKLVGVNANTKYPKWASLFAAYLTNEENQLKRFDVTGECPSIIEAARSEKVLASPAVTALANQAPYSTRQSIAAPFWNPSTVLGTVMASGNPDHVDLQELLDDFVEKVQKPEE